MPVKDVIDPAAVPTIDNVANTCLASLFDNLSWAIEAPRLENHFLSINNLTQVEPGRSLLASNTIGALPPTIPIFLSQGAADDTIPLAVTRKYMKQLCAGGSAVQTLTLPNVGHTWVGYDSAAVAIGWISERFAGTPAPTDYLPLAADRDRHGMKLSQL